MTTIELFSQVDMRELRPKYDGQFNINNDIGREIRQRIGIDCLNFPVYVGNRLDISTFFAAYPKTGMLRIAVICAVPRHKATDDGYVLSIAAGLLDTDITGYFECAGYYFDPGYYVETVEGGVSGIDDASFCEYFEQHTSEPCIVYIGRNQYIYSRRAVDYSDLYWYDGSYYDMDALDYNNLYMDEDGEISDEPPEQYVRPYHSGNVRTVRYSLNPRFYVGFEVEKEDEGVKESIHISDFEHSCPLWRKERDGSLDDYAGFELVSPKFQFLIGKIEKIIRQNDVLRRHINANFSTSCGGHISVSEAGKNAETLFNDISGYVPFFYALYPGRANNRYCSGKSAKQIVDDKDKFQAFNLDGDRLEIRIFSAVSNVSQLIWRLKLVKFILLHQTKSAIDAERLIRTKLDKLLRLVYSDEKMNIFYSRLTKKTEELCA